MYNTFVPSENVSTILKLQAANSAPKFNYLNKSFFVSQSNCSGFLFSNGTKVYYTNYNNNSKAAKDEITVKGDLASSSMTIIYITLIDEGLTIDNFEVGKSVYMTGKVYVKDLDGEQ